MWRYLTVSVVDLEAILWDGGAREKVYGDVRCRQLAGRLGGGKPNVEVAANGELVVTLKSPGQALICISGFLLVFLHLLLLRQEVGLDDTEARRAQEGRYARTGTRIRGSECRKRHCHSRA
jgi:hypothetical protein